MGALLGILLPLAGPIVEGLVKGVERLFGPKTGDVKREAVVSALAPVLAALSTAGKIPGIPDATTTTALVEMIVQGLKKSGELDSDTTHRTITVPVGAKITIEL